MCDLNRKSKKQKQGGWKIVAVDEKGDYYSPAMGCKYPKKGKVPVVKVQNKIDLDFNSDILESPETHKSEMVGRTAIFLRKKDAVSRVPYSDCFLHGYRPAVKKAIISDDIMLGSYGRHRIAAGRHIEFLE